MAINSTAAASAHCVWAVVIARIYEVFPLICPVCAGRMRQTVFITDGAEVRKMRELISVASQDLRIVPARGPQLWDDGDAQPGEGVHAISDWDMAAHNQHPTYDGGREIFAIL